MPNRLEIAVTVHSSPVPTEMLPTVATRGPPRKLSSAHTFYFEGKAPFSQDMSPIHK